MQDLPHRRRRRTPRIEWILALGLCALALGCATPRPKLDPLAPINRGAYALDAFTHRAVFDPLERGADAVTPAWVRTGIGNMFHNLSTPKLFLAALLQGKLEASAQELLRFAINTPLGVLGLFDVAARAGLEAHDEDMGQTLCVWRVPVGPYVYFPLLGPSSAAEAVSSTLDLALAPADLMLPYFARDASRARLNAAIAEAGSAGLPSYDFQRIAYQKNRLRAARDEAGFVTPSAAELSAETAHGTCGYQGAP